MAYSKICAFFLMMTFLRASMVALSRVDDASAYPNKGTDRLNNHPQIHATYARGNDPIEFTAVETTTTSSVASPASVKMVRMLKEESKHKRHHRKHKSHHSSTPATLSQAPIMWTIVLICSFLFLQSV